MSSPRAARHIHLLRLISCLAALAVVLLSGPLALAQTSSPTRPGAEAPAEAGASAAQPIPLAEVPDRAEATRAELDAFVPKAAPGQMLERIGAELDRTLPEVEALLAKTQETLAERPGIPALNASEAALSAMQERLQPWDDELDRQLAAIHPALARLDTIAADWAATGEVAQREGATTTTLNLIAAVRHEIDQVHAAVLARRNQILAVLDRMVDPNASLSASLREVQHETQTRLTGIFRVDRPPLWSPEVRSSLRQEWQAVGTDSFSQRLQEGGRYARLQARMIGFQLALFIVLGLVVRSLRERARTRTKDEYDLGDAEKVFERPWAIALVITLLLTSPLHPLAPRYIGAFAAVLITVALVRIGRRFLVPAMAPLAWGLIILFVFDRSRVVLDTTPTLGRVAFLTEMAAVLAFPIRARTPQTPA
jgi:hypothetical protein